jgi:pyrroloquinoline-quinone synthase
MFNLDHQLPPDEFIQTFFEVNRQDQQRPPHPWEALFRNGKCTRDQLQGWAKERYYFTKQVPIKEYSILYNCPHTDVRRMWLPKAIEEEGEDLIGKAGKPHPEYWLDVCVGLGLDREFVKRSEPLFGVKFAVDSFANAAFKTSWLLGVAVSEGDDTARAMARDLDTFRKHYSWVPDDALTFYKLHADVDVEHGVIRKEILKKYADTKELQEACINAQLMKNNMRRAIADAIYMAYVVRREKVDGSSAAETAVSESSFPS